MNKWFTIGLIIAGVIFATIFISVTDSGLNDISQGAAVDIGAAGDMTEIVGVQDAVEGFPVWKWFIAPVIGVVMVAWTLARDRMMNR